jgi:hypothetical protein
VPAAGDPELSREAVAEAARILKESPKGLIAVPAPPAALAPLAALAQAMFFDVTERRFRSYEVLDRLRRP